MEKNVFFKQIFFILIILIFIAPLYCSYYLYSHGPLKESITLIIPPKINLSKISEKLKDNNVIKHKMLFLIMSKLYSYRSSLKSGEYEFPSFSSPLTILKILSSGTSVIHKVIFVEGHTIAEIIERINQDPILQGEMPQDIIEGDLMPNTYFYSYGDTKEKMINQMKNKMSITLTNVFAQLPVDSPIQTTNQLVTLASIVEKETSIDDEKPMVAAVFLNRLKIGMKLQADPTTIYAITFGATKLNRKLTKNDLEMQSSYNTYYIKGLPPGPICCPGIKSIEAVAKPADTKDLFFVATGNGGHSFSETLDEHIKNIEIYHQNLNNNAPPPSID